MIESHLGELIYLGQMYHLPMNIDCSDSIHLFHLNSTLKVLLIKIFEDNLTFNLILTLYRNTRFIIFIVIAVICMFESNKLKLNGSDVRVHSNISVGTLCAY